jgi:hypothetical protein
MLLMKGLRMDSIGDSGDGWDEDGEADGALGGLEATNNYGGEDVEEEEEGFMSDGWAEQGVPARGEPYPACNHDGKVLMTTLSAHNPLGYPASSPKSFTMAMWEELQLRMFEASSSKSSPAAILTRWRVLESVCTIGTRS